MPPELPFADVSVYHQAAAAKGRELVHQRSLEHQQMKLHQQRRKLGQKQISPQ